jgi:HNH endonuclease/AP2 domain
MAAELCVMIPLNGMRGQGQYTFVSPADIQEVNKCRWWLDVKGYIVGNPNGQNNSLHRFIAEQMGLDLSKEIDHIDNNKSNNCRSNLRSVTHLKNMQNIGIARNNTSGFKGVSYNKHARKWQVRININRRNTYIGIFDTFEDACRARILAEQQYWN